MQETTTPRVLIVDDEEDLCQYLKLMISKKANYEVDIATDGEMAFEKLKKERFNLVISDINMPKMNGIELLTNIKNYDPDIEVIMLTGKSSLETAVQALQIKAFDYIEKPVESRKLLVAMGNALGKQRLNLELKTVLDRVSKERKELKQKVEQQAAELARKERLAITGAVAATLTGELLQPVGDLCQRIDGLLASKQDSTRVESIANEMKPIAERLRGLLEEVVAFSEQSRPSFQPFSVSEFLRKLVEQHASVFNEVEFQLTGSVEGVEINGDEIQLGRAISVIVENACDAMKGSGKVLFHVSSNDEGIRLAIEDSGPGIDEEAREKIFLPFYTTKGSQGSGLGMPIAKRIVEDHGGSIRIENGSAASGACFVLELPRLASI